MMMDQLAAEETMKCAQDTLVVDMTPQLPALNTGALLLHSTRVLLGSLSGFISLKHPSDA